MTKPHHTKSGFRNLNPDFEDHGLTDVLKWVSGRWSGEHSLEPEDYPPFPVVSNDGKVLRENDSKLSVTWIGHATTLVQIDGVNILTDPIWSDRCSPVSFAGPKRYTPPGLRLEDLPRIDVVILSHNHYDHTDLSSLKLLEEKHHPKFLAGLGNKPLLKGIGLSDVEEMDWWDSVERKGVKFVFTPTQHFSGRGLTDRYETLWGSYAILGKSQKVYFGGDTGYYTHFKEIGKKFDGFDVAILPIGAFEPRWFMSSVHVDPEQSVRAFADLRAKFMVPMHYMTFVLSDEKLDSPVPLARKAFEDLKLAVERLVPLKIGESRFF
ncbi:membrane protein [Leptospira kobayashii]|uniref:Membrane protein n=1 Tax=Leptospira kobayashii TaxID=1917830 RepID=A0ABM7ULY6_9LEPT|nr:MBL fold metallo-hydrolase [Leptospira kobayashii]BDA79907.1 membrane protein [Leptospira kobayashii]